MMKSSERQATQQVPGYWFDIWRRYRRNKPAMVASCYVFALFIIAIASPLIVGTKPVVCKYKGKIYFPFVGYYYDRWENPALVKLQNRYPAEMKKRDPESWAVYPLIYQDPVRRVRTGEREGYPENPGGEQGFPTRNNLCGTTKHGFDVFAHIIHGSRQALLVGFVSMGIAAAIGIMLGAIAGYFGGWIDILLSRLIEIVMCLPTLVLILTIISLLEKPNIWHTMAIIGLTSWTGIARLTRGEFLKLKNLDYVQAARALGAGHLRIMFRHILPNALAPVLVPISFGIASAILLENALRFLGLGDPSSASWGKLLNEGKSLESWWLIVYPGLAVFFTVLAYNLIGEGLQEATDPRLRESRK